MSGLRVLLCSLAALAAAANNSAPTEQVEGRCGGGRRGYSVVCLVESVVRGLGSALLPGLALPGPSSPARDLEHPLHLPLHLNRSSLLPFLKGVTAGLSSGRGRKGSLYAVGTIAAVGFAMLAALSGKALMASMFALMMSGMNVLRGGAGGGGGGGGDSKVTQYEIIKPHYSPPPAHYYEHEHHHNSYSPYSYTKRALHLKDAEDDKDLPRD